MRHEYEFIGVEQRQEHHSTMAAARTGETLASPTLPSGLSRRSTSSVAWSFSRLARKALACCRSQASIGRLNASFQPRPTILSRSPLVSRSSGPARSARLLDGHWTVQQCQGLRANDGIVAVRPWLSTGCEMLKVSKNGSVSERRTTM